MRRKPSGGNYPNNNQHRRPQRFQNGGDQRPQHQHQHRGPRRNWGQAQQKYLEQARNALAAGDRVLAENYYQHADHCYRMMVEEGSFRPQQQVQPQVADGAGNGDANANNEGSATGGQPEDFQDNQPVTTSHLPAFITAVHGQSAQEHAAEPPPVQNWEERDA